MLIVALMIVFCVRFCVGGSDKCDGSGYGRQFGFSRLHKDGALNSFLRFKGSKTQKKKKVVTAAAPVARQRPVHRRQWLSKT